MSTRYYLSGDDVDATCPVASIFNRDLSFAPSGGTLDVQPTATAFVRKAVFDRDVSGETPATGDHDVNIEFTMLANPGERVDARVRLVCVDDDGCTDLEVSDWSSIIMASGTLAETLTLTWDAGGERLRLEVWLRTTDPTPPPQFAQIDLGDSWVLAPWTFSLGPSMVRNRECPHQDARALLDLGGAIPRRRAFHLKPGAAEQRLASRPRHRDPHQVEQVQRALAADFLERRPLLKPGDDTSTTPQHVPIRATHQQGDGDVARMLQADLPRPRAPLLRPDPAAPVAGGLAPRRQTDRRMLQKLLELLSTPRTPERRRIGGAGPARPVSTQQHRINSPGGVFVDRPFSGQGVSVYVTAGARVVYRALRVLGGVRRRRRTGWIKGQGGNHDLAALSVLKTTRRASAAGTSGDTVEPTVDLTAIDGAAGALLAIDARHYRDDVEHLSEAAHVQSVDGGHDPVDEILGRAVLLSLQVRAGGVVRIRFRWIPSAQGTQPDLFRALATAGPDTAAAVTISAGSRGVYRIDTPALLDSAPYTYTVRAENSAGTVTADLLTGIAVQADASGPPAVSQLLTQDR